MVQHAYPIMPDPQGFGIRAGIRITVAISLQERFHVGHKKHDPHGLNIRQFRPVEGKRLRRSNVGDNHVESIPIEVPC